MVFGAAQTPDKTAEIADIAGMDISTMLAGEGLVDVEHITPGKAEDPQKAAFKSDTFNTIIGRIIYCKKIFTEKDCDTERQEAYWNTVKVPFLYIQAELFDDDGHPGAIAAAAVIRHFYKRKLPIRLKWSIEGATIDKKDGVILRSIAKNVRLNG